MDDLQTGDNDLTGVPPTLDDLGDDDLPGGTPPSDLGDDVSGTPPDEEEGLKAALVAERRKRQESEYRLSNIEREFQDLKTKVEKPVATDTDTQLRNMSEEELINLDIASTDIDNPNYEELKPLRRNIVKALDEKRIEKTVKALSLEEENKRIQKATIEANTRALQAYPDIDKPETELFKTTQKIMLEYGNEIRLAGGDVNRIPRFLEKCVYEAAKMLGIESKAAFERGKNTEYDRQMAAGKAGLDTGVKRTQIKEPEISENAKKMALDIGLDPKKVAIRLARMKGGK